MKTLLKLLVGVFIGFAACFLVVLLIGWVINGKSPATVIQNILSNGVVEVIVEAALIIFVAFAAAVLQVIIHEGGHLVAGLLKGYRFVSFRFMNFTLISKDGRLQWRNFDVAGTGGQCLMAPPDKPIDQIDTRFYNAGGVLANILSAAIAALLEFTIGGLPLWVETFLLTTMFIGVAFAILNGTPMKAGGVANDGYNLLQLEKDPASKQCLINGLEANALIQKGQQYKDMNERLFVLPDPIDWKNSLHMSSLALTVCRMMNRHQWEEAYCLMTTVMPHKGEMIPLLQMEFECLMVLVCIATRCDDEARQRYDKNTAKYAKQYASTQSDKQAVVMAATMVLDGDRAKAEQMLRQLESRRDRFIHQGDVDMNLDIMRWLLDNR